MIISKRITLTCTIILIKSVCDFAPPPPKKKKNKKKTKKKKVELYAWQISMLYNYTFHKTNSPGMVYTTDQWSRPPLPGWL